MSKARRMCYEFAVVNDDGAFVLSGDGRLHIYGYRTSAQAFIECYSGPEKPTLRVRRIAVETPYKSITVTRAKEKAK